MQMQRWSAMAGEIRMVRLAEGADGEEASDAGAAGDIGLLHLDAAPVQHQPRGALSVNIFASGDFYGGRRSSADDVQAQKIVGGDRLLEPAHISGVCVKMGE